jgi:hypothetical protein
MHAGPRAAAAVIVRALVTDATLDAERIGNDFVH